MVRGIALLGTLLAVACVGERRPIVLDVRTDLPAGLRDYVEETFETAYADIDVRFTEGTVREALEELRGPAGDGAEVSGESGAPFDVWWGADVWTLHAAARADLLEPYRPSWVDEPGLMMASDQDLWHALMITPWVIAFSRDDLELARAPTDWNDLRHFRWVDEIEVLDPQRSEAGSWFVTSMLAHHERETEVQAGFDWLIALDGQVDTYSGSVADAVRALGAGRSRLAVLPQADVESARADEAPWLYYRVPESGSPVLARGVAVVAGTGERESAQLFVEHLGAQDIVTAAKLETRWQPAFGDADPARVPMDFELAQMLRPYPLDVDRTQRDGAGWLDRWEREVRGR